MADLLKPDEILAKLQQQYNDATSESQRKIILEKINERQQQVFASSGFTNVGFGGAGYYLPGAGQGIGKEVLEPTGTPGVYTKSKITTDTSRDPYGRLNLSIVETNDPAAVGMPYYNPNAKGTKRVFYDANGNPLPAEKVAATSVGQDFANAGYDIGYGAGVIPEGTPVAKKTDTSTSTISAASSVATGYTGSGTAGDPLKFNDIPYTGSYLGMNFVSGISTVSSAAKAERQSAYDALVLEFNKYGLGSLVKTVQGLIEKDVSPSQFIIELRNSPEYQQRFSANAERLKKGLSALSEAEYIRNEDNYRQILRTYGLTQFDNDAYVNQFLVNDVSPQELGERVVTAVNQIQMADPAITSTLRRFYGLKDSDMIGAILDPKTQLPQIQRTIAAAGIGTAAGRQGLNIGRDVAEQLAAQGVSQQEAERGYATIAEILPTAEKLSDIYGEQLGRYGLPEAEQEVFNQLASAQRKRQRLVERERAAFSGQSGVGRGSLSSPIGGQY